MNLFAIEDVMPDFKKFEEYTVGKLDVKDNIEKNMLLLGISRKLFTHSLPLVVAEQCYEKLLKDAKESGVTKYIFTGDLINEFPFGNKVINQIKELQKNYDVYVVKDELGKQKLLPGIDEVIKQIDLESSKIIVNLIEGL